MMGAVVQWIRSLLFCTQMYLALVLFAVAFAPWAAFDRRGARMTAMIYCRWVRWTAGLDGWIEIRDSRRCARR